jgi:Mrp family chromosome partitioning ATPase
MSPLENYTRNVARRWKVVIAFAVLGAVLATAWWFAAPRTTWTGTAALSTQSQERAPEQDAVLALGYVNYFNQPSYQQLLHTQVAIPAGVKLAAEMGATSPIMYITATGRSANDARDAAALAAEAFREDVRASLVVERRRAAADLQAQVDANVKLLGQRGYNDAVVLDQIRSLQGRMTDIQADNTNMLKQLQPEPGVASTTPSPLLGIVAGAAGGLVTGVLVALLLTFLDRRLRTPADIRQRTGLSTLAELHRGMDVESRRRVAATVINTLSLTANECRIVIAVAAPRRSSSTHQVAVELASTVAGRRAGALLVEADLRWAGSDSNDQRELGVLDVLEGRSGLHPALARASNGLKVLRAGSLRGRDLQGLIEPNRVVDMVSRACTVAGVVVVELPPVLEAAEAQVLAAAADRVVMVVERGVTLAPDVVTARQMLDVVGALMAGVIVVDPDDGGSAAVELLGPEPDEVVTSISPDPDDGTDESVIMRADTNGSTVNGSVVNGAAVSGAMTNGSGVNGAVANGSGVNSAVANGSTVDDMAPSGSAVDGVRPDEPEIDGTGADGTGINDTSSDESPTSVPESGSSGLSGEDTRVVGAAPAQDAQAT